MFQLKNVVLAVGLVLSVGSAQAGNFVTLNSGVGGLLSAANGGLQSGTTNSNTDKFYLETTSATYLPGYNNTNDATSGGDGRTVESVINYRAFSGATTLSTGTLTLLDWRKTENVPLLSGVPQASIFDFVYRDSADNKLVFGTRYLNVVANNQEVNYLYRYGFTGLTTSVAWTFGTNGDLRLYQAGRSDDHTYNLEVPYSAGTVRLKSDVSVSEGNPWSGLFLVKTNAENYAYGDKAIGFYQAGEEGQAVVGGYIGGFVPQAAAVPEADTYAMMMAGLGLMGGVVRRRARKV